MKCTSCSENVKPVVALDIDGTLAKYHETFFHFWFHWKGCTVEELHRLKRYDGSVEMADWIGVSSREYQDGKLAFRAGGFKRWMPAFDELEVLMSTLRIKGVEVWVTTTRPWMRMDNIDIDTREWLRRNRVHYQGLLFDEDKYAVLCEHVDPERIVMVLEDQHDQFDRAVELGLPAFLRHTTYNRAIRRQPGCATLGTAAIAAANQIKLWKERHGG